jgi:(p)ppGpp synthase/HD superfamily hydrolase
MPGMLKSMSDVFSTLGINIQNLSARTNRDHKAVCLFEVLIKNRSQLSQVIQELQKVKGVQGVSRQASS